MNRLAFAFAGSTLLLGCGSSSNQPGAPPPAAPTFTRVTTEVITTKTCGGPLCHMLTAGGFTLGPKSQLYAALVNHVATGAKCGTAPDGGVTTHIRVVPGDPDNSLLYQKLAGNPPCGDPMPAGGMLDTPQIQLVHDWIAAGANDD